MPTRSLDPVRGQTRSPSPDRRNDYSRATDEIPSSRSRGRDPGPAWSNNRPSPQISSFDRLHSPDHNRHYHPHQNNLQNPQMATEFQHHTMRPFQPTHINDHGSPRIVEDERPRAFGNEKPQRSNIGERGRSQPSLERRPYSDLGRETQALNDEITNLRQLNKQYDRSPEPHQMSRPNDGRSGAVRESYDPDPYQRHHGSRPSVFPDGEDDFYAKKFKEIDDRLENRALESKQNNRARSFDGELSSRPAKGLGESTDPAQISLLLAENQALKRSLEEDLRRIAREGANQDDLRARVARSEIENRSLQAQVGTLKNIANKKTEDASHLEQQVQNLKEKLHHTELHCKLKQVLLSIEIERLHTIVAEKTDENEDLLQRIQELEERLAIPPHERNVRPRNDKDPLSTDDYERRVTELSDQLGRLTRDGYEKQRLINELMAENKKLLQSKSGAPLNVDSFNPTVSRFGDKSEFFDGDKIQGNIQTLHETIINYENRLALFMIEIERLHHVVDEVTTELEEWKERALQYEGEPNNLSLEQSRDPLLSGVGEPQLKNSLAKLNAEKNVLNQQLQAYKSRVADLEKRLEEAEVGGDTTKRLTSRGSWWQEKYQNLETKYNHDVDALKRELLQATQNTTFPSQASFILPRDKAQFSGDTSPIRDTNIINQTKMIMFMIELERLQDVLATKEVMIENLREKLENQERRQKKIISDMKSEYEKLLEMDNDSRAKHWIADRNSLESQLEEQQNRNSELEDRMKAYHEELARLQAEKQNLIQNSEERSKLENFIRALKAKNDEQDIRVMLLMIEIDRLNGIVHGQNKSIKMLELENDELKGELEQLKDELDKFAAASKERVKVMSYSRIIYLH